MKKTLGLLLIFALAACHHGAADGNGDLATDGTDLSTANDDLATGATFDLATSCPRVPKADDAMRVIVVAHPDSASGDPSNDWETFQLAATGTITRTNTHFTMGRGANGTIVFTADGSYGYTAQDDGSIGVFKLTDSGVPTVIEAMHKDTYYATGVVMGPAGDHLYVLSAQTTNNGGGIYDAPIACDGTLGTATKLTAADLPYALVGLPKGDYALYSRALDGATTGQTVHRVTLGPPLTRTTSAALFTDASDNAIIASATRTHDGKWALFGDNSQFSGVDNRIGAISITTDGLGATQVVTPDNDPVGLVASPYDNLILVISGFDNAFRTLKYDPTNTTAPFAAQGDITYVGAKPQLPYGAVMIERGMLKGTVYVSENVGIRPVRFEAGGTMTDIGLYSLGSGLEQITGSIGVTP
jgi:hypothetical protein